MQSSLLESQLAEVQLVAEKRLMSAQQVRWTRDGVGRRLAVPFMMWTAACGCRGGRLIHVGNWTEFKTTKLGLNRF